MYDEEIAEGDNVVGRLYNIINKLKNTPGENVESIFSKVFELDKKDKARMMINYAEMFKMCSSGIEEVNKLNPKNAGKYISTLNATIEGLSTISFINTDSRDNGMLNFFQYFDSELMLSLGYCADFLSEHSKEHVIENEIIEELITEVDLMTREIFESKIDYELEKILVFQLSNIREALLKYKLYGSQGIMNCVTTTVGTLILNNDKVSGKTEIAIVEMFFGVLSKINTIFSIKTNAINTIEGIYRMLINKE